ncbi:hypothetical protein UWK_01683 [Desulfocapsa sulfexigens DSM 10523]|uniref:Uncharacterized protein n=2 Tax=Desulfocapsa TaxID=53318 RepID=M1PP91_DESSD|nr:hypothetical protein UWK_01683 [Desulfocapsa sulfexigens DSM 10523]
MFFTQHLTRKEILITWLFGSILLMLIVSVISMLTLHFTSQPDPTLPIQPIEHFFSMAFRVPVGWFLSFLTPFGWANIFFLCLSILTRRQTLLTGSAIATVLSGIWWPTTYITMTNL